MPTPTHTLERVESEDRAQRHWRERQQAVRLSSAERSTPAWTIAMDRETGAGGTSVARAVAARLGWPVYDHELLERIAQEKGLRVRLLESIDERRQSWLVESMEGFSEMPSVSENAYVRHLVETVLSLGMHGHCIIVGRGSAQVLPPATTLRVRLVALRRDRIARTAQRLSLSEHAATRQVDEEDRERIRFLKEHFRSDPTDPGRYDVVLNTSTWSYEECADLIVQALHRLEKRSAPQ
jgi:cytidylate kinase